MKFHPRAYLPDHVVEFIANSNRLRKLTLVGAILPTLSVMILFVLPATFLLNQVMIEWVEIVILIAIPAGYAITHWFANQCVGDLAFYDKDRMRKSLTDDEWQATVDKWYPDPQPAKYGRDVSPLRGHPYQID